MPNTPMMVGEGCTAFCPGVRATPHDIILVKRILEVSGVCKQVPESMINAIGALAGSGPAFVSNIGSGCIYYCFFQESKVSILSVSILVQIQLKEPGTDQINRIIVHKNI